MKKLLLLLLLAPSLAQAQQPPFVRNDNNTTVVNGVNGRQASASVDDKGIQSVKTVDPSTGEVASVIPVSNASNLNGVGTGLIGFRRPAVDTAETGSTTTVINATTHVVRAGDSIVFTSGTAGNINVWSPVSSVTTNTITLANALPATPANGDGFSIMRPQPIASTEWAATGNGAALIATLDSSYQNSAATGILKLEDAPAASGDALVGVAGVINSTYASKAVDGDYTAPSLTVSGGAYSVPVYDSNVPTSNSLSALEDSAQVAGSGGVKILYNTQDPLSVDQTNTDDLGFPKVDRAGRTITTLAPAGEMFYSCSTQVSTNTTVAIKAAVTSNRIYVTQLNCSNDSATGSFITIKDGTTTLVVDYLPANSAGGRADLVFPVPLRGTVNTALNATWSTTGTSSFCCASGYISIN